jgi:DNA-binding transcriptional ArsR family regulator
MPARKRKSGAARSAPIFAALGDERRLHLVTRVCAEGPVSITALAHGSDISRQATTKHLNVLARAGLVRAVRQGRERLYAFDPEPLQQARHYLDTVANQWDQALGRLTAMLEAEPTV